MASSSNDRDQTKLALAALFVKILAAVIPLVTTPPASAHDPVFLWDAGASYLATATRLSIKTIDEVTDGCWPSPSAAAEAAELELRRNGFQIDTPQTADSRSNTRLVVQGTGYLMPNTGACAVAVRVTLVAPIFIVVPFHTEAATSVGEFALNERAMIMTGQKSTMQDRIRGFVTEATAGIILEILRERELLFAVHPEIKARFEEVTAKASQP